MLLAEIVLVVRCKKCGETLRFPAKAGDLGVDLAGQLDVALSLLSQHVLYRHNDLSDGIVDKGDFALMVGGLGISL